MGSEKMSPLEATTPSENPSELDGYCDLIWESSDVLIVDKRPGILTMGQTRHEPSVLSAVSDYLRYSSVAAQPFVAVIGRLDVPAAGLLVIAKHAASADSLWKQQRDGQISKRYLALVEGNVQPPASFLEHWLLKHRRHRRVTVSDEVFPHAQWAGLNYRVVTRWPWATGLAISLQTGRKHQIRAQLSHVGFPVCGDRKYGGKAWSVDGIGLYCQRLEFSDPSQSNVRRVFARPTPWDKWVTPMNEAMADSVATLSGDTYVRSRQGP